MKTLSEIYRGRSLPRLLYVSDVPIEASYHGSALLHRLLEGYPAKDLVAVEHKYCRSWPERRLANVRYEVLSMPWQRILTTRFHAAATSLLMLTGGLHERRLYRLMADFRPQAVLTVGHGFLWMAAANFAERNRLPLHLIVHDDWPRVARVVKTARSWLDRRFGDVYRRAASRLCVSPYMVEEYERRYGAKGSVLYPSRGPDTPTFDTAPNSNRRQNRPFTVAFAGTLNTPEHVRQLAVLSRLLATMRGRLLLFGPFSHDALVTNGVSEGSIVTGGLLRSAELIHRLRDEADVLFVPASFATEEIEAFALNFPSKLTDYTAAALALLIWGPKNSSAVRWASSKPETAAVVTSPNAAVMERMLEKLACDTKWRQRLAKAAADAGKSYFSPERARTLFYESLLHCARPADARTGTVG
jgi:glycosyltransferase involved in cell wall biosynthesis